MLYAGGFSNPLGVLAAPDGTVYVADNESPRAGPYGTRPYESGSVVRVKRNARKVSLASLPRRSTLVATGMRNIFDLAFSPVDPTKLFIPMNGVDDAREGSTADKPGPLEDSDDVLFLTDIGDARKDNMGFPSCLYNRVTPVIERARVPDIGRMGERVQEQRRRGSRRSPWDQRSSRASSSRG